MKPTIPRFRRAAPSAGVPCLPGAPADIHLIHFMMDQDEFLDIHPEGVPTMPMRLWLTAEPLLT